MKYLNILLIILPFIFSCSSDTPENDKEKIPPIIDTSIRVGTFNVDVGDSGRNSIESKVFLFRYSFIGRMSHFD